MPNKNDSVNIIMYIVSKAVQKYFNYKTSYFKNKWKKSVHVIYKINKK